MNETKLNKNLQVEVGPSGRAVSQAIEENLLSNLYQHLTMERNANVQYFSMALWFKERDLNGFSSYFLRESQDEMDHAIKFSNYLIARGQTVELQDLPAPLSQWNSIEELISYSFKMESDLTTSIQQLYSLSERSSDVRTNVFLDPFIDAQVKSEDEFANLLGKVKFSENQPSALLIIDSSLYEK